MHETFKNVSIFIMFIVSVILSSAAKPYLIKYFSFHHGQTVFTCLWACCMVIFFHLLFYYFGTRQEKTIYFSALFAVLVLGGLVYFRQVALA